MFSKDNSENKETKEQQDHNSLVELFDLLFKIDKRENPERYKINNNNKDDD